MEVMLTLSEYHYLKDYLDEVLRDKSLEEEDVSWLMNLRDKLNYLRG